jgi:shikimate kinase/3-dehydroquinate synthase
MNEIKRPHSSIFLYGPPGSGKSTLGNRLAEALGVPFIDLDERIESQAGTSIPEIFASQGEAHFRRWERELLVELVSNQPGGGVIALGGGALLDPANRQLVEDHGRVLFLDLPEEALASRIPGDGQGRPLLAGDAAARLRHLLEERGEHYASFPLRLDIATLETDQAVWEAQVLLGRFQVEGMGKGYEVRVDEGGLDALGELFRSQELGGPVAVVSDENVAPLYLERVQGALLEAGYTVHPVVIPAGEQHKTMDTVSELWAAFLLVGLDRGSTVLALGGGVVGDLAGFAAATYMRGVPWVVVPTSLLAMVDASMGGKTGADLPQGKNLVGAFHAPRLVLADPETLATLPEVEWINGMAEVLKHGVIADRALFELCAEGLGVVRANLSEVVRRGMAVKVRIIQEDPFEGGRRAALNLGHTVGHGVELASGFRLRHGEAVSIGMVAEARLSEVLGLGEAGLADTLAEALSNLGLPVAIPPELDRREIIAAMRYDKKRAGGKVRFALPRRIGEVQVGVEIDDLELTIGG